MISLSAAEFIVAKEYCKGLEDKEVADNLKKSIWTIKTQKKTIYRKLGISKETELFIYMLCNRLEKDFDLKEIRKHGIEFFFSLLFLVIAVAGDFHIDMRNGMNRAKAPITRAIRAKRHSDTDCNNFT